MTHADPTWMPLLTTPPYPSYAGNMACIGASTARALALFFGTNDALVSVQWSSTDGINYVALRAYTAAAARQLFLEDKIGSLEPGKEADIAVWDRNFYSVAPAELKDAKWEMTLFDGKVVYQRPN